MLDAPLTTLDLSGLQQVSLRPEIKNSTGAPATSTLTLYNDDATSDYEITKLLVGPADPVEGKDKSSNLLPAASVTIAKSTAMAPIPLPGTALCKWRVWVDFKKGTDTMSGVIDVTAT